MDDFTMAKIEMRNGKLRNEMKNENGNFLRRNVGC